MLFMSHSLPFTQMRILSIILVSFYHYDVASTSVLLSIFRKREVVQGSDF